MYNTSLQESGVQNQLFPQGLATGVAFYNRENERKKLTSSFLNGEHTVVVAPRRYGKSSLIKQVIIESKIPGVRVDLLAATNSTYVQKSIKKAVSELITAIAPGTKKAKLALIELIKKIHPKLILNLLGQQVEISVSQTPESSITELLIGLNTAAEKTKNRVVLCFDEFQQVGFLSNNHGLEASIRHAVESSTYVTYVFSGSSRHLLSQMFSEKNRPLYHLCDLMKLERIKMDTYTNILSNRAKKNWDGIVNRPVINEILALTHRHPYYVNALCRALWKHDKKPTIATVQKSWLQYVDDQKPWIIDDIARLTPHQRSVLGGIAYNNISEPYSGEFQKITQLAPSQIKRSLEGMLREDILYKDKHNFFRVLDPAIETCIKDIARLSFEDK
jgi:uncharacterized protein